MAKQEYMCKSLMNRTTAGYIIHYPLNHYPLSTNPLSTIH